MSVQFLVAEKILEILNLFGSVPIDFITMKLDQDPGLIERYIQNFKAKGLVEYDSSMGKVILKDRKPQSGILNKELSRAFNHK